MATRAAAWRREHDAAWWRAHDAGTALLAAVEQHRQLVRVQAPAVLGQMEAVARLKIARSAISNRIISNTAGHRRNTPASNSRRSRSTVWPDSNSCGRMTAASGSTREEQTNSCSHHQQQRPRLPSSNSGCCRSCHPQPQQEQQRALATSSHAPSRNRAHCWQQQHTPQPPHAEQAQLQQQLRPMWAGTSNNVQHQQQEELTPLITAPVSSCWQGIPQQRWPLPPQQQQQQQAVLAAWHPSTSGDSRGVDGQQGPAVVPGFDCIRVPGQLQASSSSSSSWGSPGSPQPAGRTDEPVASTIAASRRRPASPVGLLLETCHAAACQALHSTRPSAVDPLLQPLLLMEQPPAVPQESVSPLNRFPVA